MLMRVDFVNSNDKIQNYLFIFIYPLVNYERIAMSVFLPLIYQTTRILSDTVGIQGFVWKYRYFYMLSYFIP